MRLSILMIEFFMVCVIIIYSVLSYELHSNWKVIESILLTKVVNITHNKDDNLENYASWVAGALTTGIVATTCCIIFGILFMITDHKPVYMTAVFVFFILFIALLTVGIFANNNIADDLGTFKLIGEIVTKQQSNIFRYGPVFSNYISSAICLIISIMTYTYIPENTIVGGRRR